MKSNGFTLIEVLIAVAIVAILAAIALPSYVSYLDASKSKSATADLASLSLSLENSFQKTLNYPVYASNTTIPPLPASRSGAMATNFGAWAPSQASAFTYSITSSANSYALTATGMGSLACTLTLNNQNVRTVAGSDCGFTNW
jgi:prepilin-type N-terminal cleavage/methylation domain-containing protein